MADLQIEKHSWVDDVDNESENQEASDSASRLPLDEEESPEEPQAVDATLPAEPTSTIPSTSIKFNLDTFKTEKCALVTYHFPCPYYHSERDRRRPQSQYFYNFMPCRYVKRGKEWGSTKQCIQGDQCIFAHSLAEVKYHKELYRTQKCQKEECEWGEMCAYRHEPKIPAPEAPAADLSSLAKGPIDSVSPPATTGHSGPLVEGPVDSVSPPATTGHSEPLVEGPIDSVSPPATTGHSGPLAEGPTDSVSPPQAPATTGHSSLLAEGPIDSVSPSQVTSEGQMEHDLPHVSNTLETFLDMYTAKFKLCELKKAKLKSLEGKIETAEKELRSLNETQKCRKCLQRPMSMAAVECGHLVCFECGNEATCCPCCFKPSFMLSLQSI